MKARFFIRYRRRSMCGRPGWDYSVRNARRELIAEGWSAGAKADAEHEARRDIAFHLALPALMRAS